MALIIKLEVVLTLRELFKDAGIVAQPWIVVYGLVQYPNGTFTADGVLVLDVVLTIGGGQNTESVWVLVIFIQGVLAASKRQLQRSHG